MGVTYTEWKATCGMTLVLLWKLLELANTSSEVMEFMSNHDIDKAARENVHDLIDVWWVDTNILAFLSVSSLQD